MFLVVFAHILFQLQDKSELINSVVDYIYMFHMPAFVFVSGYLGKSERSHSFEGIIKLIFLYFIFNSLMGFACGFPSLLVPLYSYWYLLALIAWRLTAHHLARFKEINLILFAVALFVGFYPSIDNTFAVARIICFYPYYMIGYQMSKEKSTEFLSKKYSKRMAVGLLLLVITAVIAFAAYSFFRYNDSALMMGCYREPVASFGRIVLYIISFLAIYILRCITPEKNIPLLTKFGQNSLWIYILHRPFTLVMSEVIGKYSDSFIILVSIPATIILCMILGSDLAAKYLNRFLASGVDIFISDNKKFTLAKLATLGVSLLFVASVVMNSYKGFSFSDIKKRLNGEVEYESIEDSEEDIIYPVMTENQKKAFDDTFRITFAGDLILLEDQVKRAYNGDTYDFTDVFEYAEPYISSADLAIGVFEGPMAGAEAGYTTSNYDDSKELYLNFPDEFAYSVKDAGFDLVTTANNHLLDKGEEGAFRTLDVLDEIGLEHTGSYRNAEDKEKNHVKMIECQGIRIAILSYTFGSNYVTGTELSSGKYSYITSVIFGTKGDNFEKLKKNVEQDFKDAKALSPDLILVLPHIGTQFSNEPDKEQETWFNIFKENGADIILGDHSHAVQPAFIENISGKSVFTAYCPGNFANVYREKQGDTSMLIDVYIDRNTKSVIGGSIVPLNTHAPADGNFRAVPVYDIMNDPELRKELTTDDIDRAAESNEIITNVVFGHKMDISSITERYYFNENGFIRSRTDTLPLTEEMKNSTLYKEMEKAESICFIGDSVTEGTKNGGCPWYEPIEGLFPQKEIKNYSRGGCTVSYMTDNADKIPAADLYIVALGTNDVRYRDEEICAMTSEKYVSKMKELKKKLSSDSPDAKFIFIAPWYSTDGDEFCDLSFKEKTALNQEYSDALEKFCSDNSIKFINPNDYIRNKLMESPQSTYLLDHIHPNASEGVMMYSEAVLSE